MRLEQMIARMRTLTGYPDAGPNSDATYRDLLNMAYEQAVTELSNRNPKFTVAIYDLDLDGLLTPLPQGTGRVVRVEDVSGVSSATAGRIDAAGEFVASPAATGAALTPGTVLQFIGPSLDDDGVAAGVVGYTIIGGAIKLIGADYQDTTLRIFHVAEPALMEDDRDSADLIPRAHHMALVWHAVKAVHERDGDLSPERARTAVEAWYRMLGGMAQPDVIRL